MNAQQAKQVNMWREELLRQKKILIENGNKISEEDQQQLLLNYSKMLEIIETPVCVIKKEINYSKYPKNTHILTCRECGECIGRFANSVTK